MCEKCKRMTDLQIKARFCEKAASLHGMASAGRSLTMLVAVKDSHDRVVMKLGLEI